MKRQVPIDGRSPHGGGNQVITGSAIHDDDGDLIGRVYTVAEVCDEPWPGVRL